MPPTPLHPGPLHAGVKATLEFGPIAAFVLCYLLLRDRSFVFGAVEYSGFIVVTAAFIPVFLAATAVLWYVTGRIAKIQVVAALMLVLFGGLGLWFNDPRLIKMKPTAVYLMLGLLLILGLLRGKMWLEYIMEDMIPMKPAGWAILTKRVIAVCLLSAAANELVWRTQSERFWVLFETLAMPLVIFGFFVLQIGLVVEHATFGKSRK